MDQAGSGGMTRVYCHDRNNLYSKSLPELSGNGMKLAVIFPLVGHASYHTSSLVCTEVTDLSYKGVYSWHGF